MLNMAAIKGFGNGLKEIGVKDKKLRYFFIVLRFVSCTVSCSVNTLLRSIH